MLCIVSGTQTGFCLQCS